MDIAAKVTSKGQFTVPKDVRDALGIAAGDKIIFRVEGNHAVLARTSDFLDLAGTFRVPAAKRNVAWDDVVRRARSNRASFYEAPREQIAAAMRSLIALESILFVEPSSIRSQAPTSNGGA